MKISSWLDSRLRDWGFHISKQTTLSNHPASNLKKIMDGTLMGEGGIISGSGYWPNSRVADTHAAIMNLPDVDVRIMYYRRAMMYTYHRTGKEVGLTRWGVMKREGKAEVKLAAAL